ncbi:MAG TPA: class I tRNA ligase family protein, partial [Elusimicrobiota bacterium]|nr:class I tRNA ligase family protein [Elusimicrobiota bacterium]
MKPYYLTTPIYYANDVPHIGHAYTTIAADVLARWKRLSGARVHFLTGTDEHGAKIAQAAGAAGQTPRAYLDRVVAKFQELWTRLTVTPDDFLRTSDARHIGVVQKIFEKLLKDGHIYLGSYEGWYCVPDETFWSESELKEGKCPACGRTVERLKEESYFFKLSAFEAPLLAHFEKHPEFLQPKSRAPEIVQFVKMGLRDLSVSRTKVAWGVPVPSNPAHTVYVWFDALINYISALG